MQKTRDQQTGAESKEQIELCLRSGDYSRALDLLRRAAAGFPNDAELSGLEKLAHEGVKRSADANRLITESQELFAQQKSGDAIQLLRKAYELDKNNSLARSILANALVEHAHSIVETDWLEAEKLSNQALALNPAHPTAKTIRNLIVDLKPTIGVEDWVAKARKLQSSGDLFAALAWVAEGLAVHPDDPKLVQLQDDIQRDQGARRRQTRRDDLKDLRRMEPEVNGAADNAAKQALAERIQAVAAKYWTDGEFLSIANRLLHRLGLAPQESSSASAQGKHSAVIFHVPRPNAPKLFRSDAGQIPPREPSSNTVLTSHAPTSAVPPPQISPGSIAAATAPPSVPLKNQVMQNEVLQAQVIETQAASSRVAPDVVARIDAPPSVVARGEILTKPPATPLPVSPAGTIFDAGLAAPAKTKSAPSPRKETSKWNATTLMLASSVATVIIVAVMFFFARRHPAPPATNVPAAVPAASASAISAPAVSVVPASTPERATPPESPLSRAQTLEATSTVPSDATASRITSVGQPPAESSRSLGTLVVVAGQNDAKVFLNGKLQRQLTQAGELHMPNLEPREYVVQVSKGGFQDPPQQRIRIRKGEEARLVFNLQPQPSLSSPHLASLTIQGGAPGTSVFVDQTLVGAIQPDGALSVSAINPGDHIVELRKERFKNRQFKKHFVAGETISLAAADAALEAAPGELTIAFAPPDARIAIVKGDLLKIVSSGVPIGLAAGTYTLTARTADGFTSSSTLEIVAGQSRALHLSLAPTGMSNWEDPGAWKHEKDSFLRKGGDFVLYGVAPASGTFVFSGMIAKGHLLQWVLNYTDPKNYVLFQMDDNNFYRTVVRNGQKTDAFKVAGKGDKKGFRTLHIRVSATEIVHQIKHGDSWTVVDHWTQPGVNLGQGKFGFYIPGDDQVALSSFSHYADLNLR